MFVVRVAQINLVPSKDNIPRLSHSKSLGNVVILALLKFCVSSFLHFAKVNHHETRIWEIFFYFFPSIEQANPRFLEISGSLGHVANFWKLTF